MSRFLSKILVAIAIAISLTACGGDDEDALPKNATEARVAFSQSALTLCRYAIDEGCPGVNRDTSVLLEEFETGSPYRYNIEVRYRNQVVFQKQQGSNFGVEHGFLSNGQYLLQVSEYSKFTSSASLFLNGRELSHPEFIRDWSLQIREYGDGWLILKYGAPYYDPGPNCSWALYNVQTGVMKLFGRADCF